MENRICLERASIKLFENILKKFIFNLFNDLHSLVGISIYYYFR